MCFLVIQVIVTNFIDKLTTVLWPVQLAELSHVVFPGLISATSLLKKSKLGWIGAQTWVWSFVPLLLHLSLQNSVSVHSSHTKASVKTGLKMSGKRKANLNRLRCILPPQAPQHCNSCRQTIGLKFFFCFCFQLVLCHRTNDNWTMYPKYIFLQG